MKKDTVIKHYEMFLKYYYTSFIVIFIIMLFLNFTWFPTYLSFLGIFMCLIGELGMYIDYTTYKNKLQKNK